MKLLFFDDFKLGVVKGENMVDVSDVVRASPLGPHDLISGLIEQFDDLRPSSRRPPRKAGRAALEGQAPAAGAEARQHRLHGRELHGRRHAARRSAPINAFHKAATAIIGDGDTMVLPDAPASIFEGEAELALIIGKRATRVQGQPTR